MSIQAGEADVIVYRLAMIHRDSVFWAISRDGDHILLGALFAAAVHKLVYSGSGDRHIVFPKRVDTRSLALALFCSGNIYTCVSD